MTTRRTNLPDQVEAHLAARHRVRRIYTRITASDLRLVRGVVVEDPDEIIIELFDADPNFHCQTCSRAFHDPDVEPEGMWEKSWLTDPRR